jgi:hypothetical protein
MFGEGDNSDSESVRSLSRRLISAVFVATAMGGTCQLPAGPINVPNGSFESPATPFVSLNFDYWQRTPQPPSWDENISGPWSNLTGIFKNTTPGSSDHIVNCDGNQASWLFANPEAGLFQDYDSVDWNDTVPTHAFDVKFEPGKLYRLTFGLIGGGYNMLPGTPLEASLYYRDAASNKVVVAANTIVYSTTHFTSRTQLVYFEVTTPLVWAGDPWAGQNIGIQFLSTVSESFGGGFWDLDDVRLSSMVAPTISNPAMMNGQFHFTLHGEPGLVLEILANTNPAQPVSNWTSLGTLTNDTGTIPFVDTSPNIGQRFYQVRQLP